MTNRRRLRLAAIASMSVVALTLAVNAADDVRSPFEEANAMQRQLRGVVDHAAKATFAVTAFGRPPLDDRFYRGGLDGETLAKLASPLERSSGTAFAIDAHGTLLTSEHVVSQAQSVWVTRDDGRVMPAIVVGTDPRSDLAILRVPGETTPLPLATDVPARGDIVATLGNPQGLSTAGAVAASIGTVSAVGRALPALSAREKRFYDDLIQVTTPLAVGNSGGPLVDLAGRAVGVLCATVDANGGASIGYAVTLSAAARERVERLRKGDEVVYGYLGVSLNDARVDRVDAQAPAAGVLLPGDRILAFDGVAVDSDASFWRLVSATKVDCDVPVLVDRKGERMELAVRPAKREANVDPVTRATQQLTWAGVTFANGDDGVRVTAVAEGIRSPFRVGATVRAIDGASTRTLVELLAALHDRAGDAMDVELAGD